VEDRREVCLEEEVGRLRRSGMSRDEIAEDLGVDAAWVEQVLEALPDEDDS